jgi:hypothetical protein
VLVLGLRADGTGHVDRLLNHAADAGEPLRLTLRMLQGTPPSIRPTSQPLSVCENPSVVEAAAARLGGRSSPLVCTDGIPTTAVLRLLAGTRRTGAFVRVSADFDAAGVRITNLLANTCQRSHGAIRPTPTGRPLLPRQIANTSASPARSPTASSTPSWPLRCVGQGSRSTRSSRRASFWEIYEPTDGPAQQGLASDPVADASKKLPRPQEHPIEHFLSQFPCPRILLADVVGADQDAAAGE